MIFSTAEHAPRDVQQALTPLKGFGGAVLPSFDTKADIEVKTLCHVIGCAGTAVFGSIMAICLQSL